ncbi:hypothetical protein SAMN05444487_101142 [Marininema mesophilum]|uniref:Uncharacterized protein n=1 Tax=Marininema mesophilum TaxID=1048340 RepID=A0A1H2Q8J4_9BACL|nr:hypothetical protein SAMN05444487_101142 [Marininema mesophilum]
MVLMGIILCVVLWLAALYNTRSSRKKSHIKSRFFGVGDWGSDDGGFDSDSGWDSGGDSGGSDGGGGG